MTETFSDPLSDFTVTKFYRCKDGSYGTVQTQWRWMPGHDRGSALYSTDHLPPMQRERFEEVLQIRQQNGIAGDDDANDLDCFFPVADMRTANLAPLGDNPMAGSQLPQPNATEITAEQFDAYLETLNPPEGN